MYKIKVEGSNTQSHASEPLKEAEASFVVPCVHILRILKVHVSHSKGGINSFNNPSTEEEARK